MEFLSLSRWDAETLRRWDFPPRETSPATKSEEKRMFSQANLLWSYSGLCYQIHPADWSTQQLHCFSYCLLMTDKKQKATKVKCKREESLTKQSIFVEYRLL